MVVRACVLENRQEREEEEEEEEEEEGEEEGVMYSIVHGESLY